MPLDQHTLESRVRRLAKRKGDIVRKSRRRKDVPNADNYGGYQLIDASLNAVVLGARYDATLADIERFLRRSPG